MDLSYLIEHNNEVIIDMELLNNPELRVNPETTETQDHPHCQQQPSHQPPSLPPTKSTKTISPKTSPQVQQPRKASPKMTTLANHNNNFKTFKKNQLLKQQQSSPMAKNSSPSPVSGDQPENYRKQLPTQLSPALSTQASSSSGLSESELFDFLHSRIEGLKSSQRDMEERYNNSVQSLRKELARTTNEYENHCQQFESVKNDLMKTKIDIASLINMIKTGSAASPKDLSPRTVLRSNKGQANTSNYNSKGDNNSNLRLSNLGVSKQNATIRFGKGSPSNNNGCNLPQEYAPSGRHPNKSILSNFTKLSPTNRDI